jgi:ligand-binding sensor domain-containing protein/serine phosphatase RsbU (regulator of sigma subunit)
MKKLFSYLVFFLIVFELLAQQYPLKYYTSKDGLSNSLVTSIYQDKKGFVWVTTQGGLSKLEGNTFKNYGLEEGLSDLLLKTIVEKSDDDYLIGTVSSGLYWLKKDTITSYKKGIIPNEIYDLYKDDENNVWVANSEGLVKINSNDSLEWFTKKHDLPRYYVTHVNQDRLGNIWFGYDENLGLYKYNKSKVINFNKNNGLTNGRILNSYHDSENNTWVSAFDGLYLIENEKDFAIKIETEGLPNYYIYDITELNQDLLLISTHSEGLLVFDKKKRTIINKISSNNGLKVNSVLKILKDSENNIWISNWGEGLAKIYFSGFTFYSKKEGFQHNMINHINTYDNSFACLNSNNILQYRNNRFETIYSSDKHLAKFLEVDDKLFCAREQEFLIVDKKNQVKTYTEEYLKRVRTILKSKDGKIYLAGWGGGIVIYENQQFTPVEDDIVKDIAYFYSGFVDSKGVIWFGSWDAGLISFDGNKWRQITDKDGLPSNKITSITEDKNGNLIIGTNGGGIAIKTDKGFNIINSKLGLFSNSIFSLLADSKNRLWVGSQGNISKIDLTDLSIKNYNIADGFEGDCLFNSILEYENSIWIGTNNFLWKYNEELNFDKKQNLRIYINNIVCNNNLELDKDEFISLKHHQNKISFSFKTSQIYRQNEVKYSYRLLGADTTFSNLSYQNEISFYELAPGNYTFEVKACIEKNCSNQSAKFSFTINPPFWKTWWFATLISVFTVLLTVIYVKYRELSLIKKQKTLEKIVSERTQELKIKNNELEVEKREVEVQKNEAEKQKHIVEEKNKEILDSINYAKRIQTAILPPPKVVKSFLEDSFILYIPKDIVAGDFYWMESVEVKNPQPVIGSDEGANQSQSQLTRKILFAAADCTGHGVPGAMVSVVCNNGLNRSVREYGLTDPGKILDKTREIVIEEFQKSEEEVKDGMDIALCSLELLANNNTQKDVALLKYAGANNPLWIIKNGSEEVFEIKADKQPIGKYSDNKPFTTHDIFLDKGDIIYIFTDGFQDQFGGEKGKKFKPANLRSLLLSVKNQNLQDQRTAILNAFDAWKGNLEQVDDICLIGVRIL